MPIVMKRYRKYFTRQDGSPVPMMQEQPQHTDLLNTIKLIKNVFKLTLPQQNYEGNSVNYQTMPSRVMDRQSSQETITKVPALGSKHSNSTDVDDIKLSDAEMRRKSTKKRHHEESEQELSRVESKAKISTSRKVLETI